MGQMEGKNVFLTGASKGMGREIARGLAKEGARVALVARTESALKELAEELNGLGGKGFAIPADVSDKQQVKDAVAKARQELGEIHVLINSAGVLDNEPIAGHSDEVWEYTYDVPVRDGSENDAEEVERAIAAEAAGAPQVAVAPSQAMEKFTLRVICDPKSYLYLTGTSIDFKTDGMLHSGFAFNNPNATSSCGCGSSFSA